MTALNKTISHPLKNMKGFTIIELIVVTVIISVLSSIAIGNFIPLRKKALDTTARIDTRNFAESVVEAALAGQDVNYIQGVFGANGGVQGPIGNIDTSAVPRNPVFVLSPGVAAIIIDGSSDYSGTGQTYVEAYIYHTNGTVDTTFGNVSGRKEYFCMIDESTGVVSLP